MMDVYINDHLTMKLVCLPQPELPVAIGQKYAFFIYLFHLCVADILKDVAVAVGIEKNLLYLWMRPVMVCVFVTAVAVMYGYGMRICRK